MYVLRTGRIKNVTAGTIAHCGAAKRCAMRPRGDGDKNDNVEVRAIGKTCGASDVINAGCARYTCGPCDWDDNAECGMRQRRGRDQGQTRVFMRGNK